MLYKALLNLYDIIKIKILGDGVDISLEKRAPSSAPGKAPEDAQKAPDAKKTEDSSTSEKSIKGAKELVKDIVLDNEKTQGIKPAV